MRVTVDNAKSARDGIGTDLRGVEDMRCVSDSKSMSSAGVAENTASAANVSFNTASVSVREGAECAHSSEGNNGAQSEAAREKDGGNARGSKADDGSEGGDPKEGKSNPFMHVEENRGSALSSDNLLVC